MSSDGGLNQARQQDLLSVSVNEVKRRIIGERSWTLICSAAQVRLVQKTFANGTQGFRILVQRRESQTEDQPETLVECDVLVDTMYSVSAPTFHYFTTDAENECGVQFRSKDDAVKFSTDVIIIKEGLAKAVRRASKKRRSRKDSSRSHDDQSDNSYKTNGGTTPSSSVGPSCTLLHERTNDDVHIHNVYTTKEAVGNKRYENCQDRPADQDSAYVQFITQEEIDEKKRKKMKEVQELEKQQQLHPYSEIVDVEIPCKQQDEKKEFDVIYSQPAAAKELQAGINETCTYCGMKFSSNNNPIGSCLEAPSKSNTFLKTVTCYSCAEAVTYHCAADADGEFGDPYECDCSDSLCRRRWSFLCGLGCCLPCIFCYIPMSWCLKIGARHHLCGSRHVNLKF